MVQNLTNDIIEILEENMDAMYINLENADTDEVEVYVDFKNIFFNFIIRLNK